MKNKAKVMRNMLIGMIGACLCMVACWLSGAYGEGNVRNGFIQSNWAKMHYLRFEISLIFSAVGIALYYIGIKDYIKVIMFSRRKRSINDMRMAKLFHVGAIAGVISYLFIHSGYVMMALVYKLLFNTSLMGADIISTTEGMFYYIAIPLIAYLVIAIAGTTMSFIYFIYIDRMRVSKICMLFNPAVTLGIGELLRLTKIYYLSDFAAASIPLGFLLMMAAGLSHTAKLPNAKRRMR